MTKLVWDNLDARIYETGISRGVVYPVSGPGIAWPGLIRVRETPSGGELETMYLDGIKTRHTIGREEFQATIDAYSVPEAFSAFDGQRELGVGLTVLHQPRARFGLSYRTELGNALDDQLGYKIHLIYNAIASPGDRVISTMLSTASATTYQWTIDAIPERITNRRPTAHLIINSLQENPTKLATLEDLLYGTISTQPALPTPAAVFAVLN